MEPGETLRILLVEDSEVHIRMVKAALGGWGGPIELEVVRAGGDALGELQGGQMSGDNRPHLILLDLGMPGMNGMELLAHIRGDPKLVHIPVIVLTGSNDDEQILATYTGGANAFVRKPEDLGEFIETMHKTMVFWTEVASLPEGKA